MSFEQQLISWRRELHQNPELSLQEVATTARIRDWLQSGGASSWGCGRSWTTIH